MLQLSISFSVVISHRASPARLLGYSPLIIRMDSVSLLTSALLSPLSQGERGLVSKSSLGLVSSSTFFFFFNFTPSLPHSSLLSCSSCQITWLFARSGLTVPSCGALEVLAGFFFSFPSAVLCPGGVEINKERARRCQKTTGISCSSKKTKESSGL